MRRFVRLIAVALTILYSAVFSASASATDNRAPISSSARYVWATSLLLRAQPDGKSPQVAKIPYGAALELSGDDAPVPHTEVFARYVVNGKTVTVTLNGAWQKVHWQDKDGWVFDGYLSRYPTPDTSTFEAKRKNFRNYASDEMLYADQLFGPGKKNEWSMKQDGIKSSSFQAAQKYMQSISQQFDTYYTDNSSRWINIEWNMGANCNYYLAEDEGWEENFSFKNLPLTFNEALLWQMHFKEISADGNAKDVHYSQFKYTPGSALIIEFTDISLYSSSIVCGEKSCDLASGSTS